MSIYHIIKEGHIKERAAAARKRIRERGVEHACERAGDTALTLLLPLPCMDGIDMAQKLSMAHDLKEAIFNVVANWVKDPYRTEADVPAVLAPIGRQAYEEDLRKFPVYHNGEPRPSWEKLSDIAKRSWERTPRDER